MEGRSGGRLARLAEKHLALLSFLLLHRWKILATFSEILHTEKMKKISLFLILAFLLSACNQNNKAAKFDYGKVEDMRYSNSFFNFTMDLPSNWYIQPNEEKEHLMDMGKDLAFGDDENLKAAADASMINSAFLLNVFKYEVGSPVDFNPCVSLIAENLKYTPGIKTGKDYLFHARKLLEQTQLQYTHIDETFSPVTIGDREFYSMGASVDILGMTITQVYYCVVINDFALNIIITYSNEIQKQELDQIISSISFS